jgi:type II secretory pathway pseudopilin PulG
MQVIVLTIGHWPLITIYCLTNKMLSFPKLPPTQRRNERGYILLMMMLFVALLAIGAAALAPSLTLQVRRDREEEMIHRGVQYSRAIRHYVKKFGRYPTRIEELENTNNLRFLRKRYKDPITGEDFKLLHVGEVQLAGGVGGIAGAATLAAAATAVGGPPGTSALLGGAVAQAARSAMAATTTTTLPGATNDSGQDAGAANPAHAGSPDSSKTDPSQSGSNPPELSSRIFGGGPIVGVASTSKAQSIREFNHKNHYNQWQFIYDPSIDKGGLITTPAQPPLQVSQPLNQPQNPSGGPSSPGGFPSPPPVQPAQPQQQ